MSGLYDMTPHEKLRRIVAEMGIKLGAVAQICGIGYRSLQDYMDGKGSDNTVLGCVEKLQLESARIAARVEEIRTK